MERGFDEGEGIKKCFSSGVGVVLNAVYPGFGLRLEAALSESNDNWFG